MALYEKVYGVKTSISARIFDVHGVFEQDSKSRKPVAAQSEIGYFAGLQLKLQFICDEGDELRIRGFSLGVAHCIAEKSLQSIQIASVPCNLDCMTDGTLHSGRRGLEGLCHLGIQNFCDSIDHVHIVDGDDSLRCLWH